MVITTHMIHRICNSENSESKVSEKNSSEIEVLKGYLKEFEKSENQEITS